MPTHFDPLGMSHNCIASREMIGMIVSLTRIDVHTTSIARFQWSCCGQTIASMYVSGWLLMVVDPRALAIIITAFMEFNA